MALLNLWREKVKGGERCTVSLLVVTAMMEVFVQRKREREIILFNVYVKNMKKGLSLMS